MNKYKWFALIFSIFVVIASSAPIIYFTLNQKNDLVFLGRRYTNSQDTYTYLSFIEQSRQGHNLFRNLYTSEDHTYSLFRPSYLLVGKLAGMTNLSSMTAYHLSRVIFSFIFLILLWRFLSLFAKEDRERFILFALILTSSGFGAFIFKWLPDSLDLWVPEANTFFSLGEAPHFILSQLLMLFGYQTFLTYLKTSRKTSLIFSFLAFLALSFEHPFNLIVIVPTLFVVCLWQKRSWLESILIPSLSSLGLLYQYYTSLSNPILNAWQSQNILLSPIPILILTGYGALALLSLIGVEKILKKSDLSPANQLILTWIVVTGLVLYSPFNFQRRLVEGLHLPLTILAGTGLFSLVTHYKLKTQNLILFLSLLFLASTSIFITYIDFRAIGKDVSDNYYYHIHKDELKALNWLKENSHDDEIILSNWYLGNLIPGLIGRQVYLGHSVQTINSDKKTKDLDMFLSTNNPQSFTEFLKANQIKYLFFGRSDTLLQSGFTPSTHPEMSKLYDQDGVQIYQVN